MKPEAQLELLKTNAVDLISEEELLAKLRLGRPLRIKYGADPSAPDLHLGHSVPMRRLKQFQDLGHTVVFIIGDFTGRIGDPSGKSKTRPMLSSEQIEANARTYAEQAGRILDLDRCEIHYNSSWFSDMPTADLLGLASRYTLARMLERDDFSLRMRDEVPISILELLYPLVQAYDSVAIRSDVEIGGTDQTFNLLVGRDIMRAYGMEPQVVMTWPLLVGTDGTEKMSKSLGNYVGITEAPGEMYGKLMSVPDAAMGDYYRLLLDMPVVEVQAMQQDIEAGTLHPREAKSRLAAALVQRYHGAEAAKEAVQEFDRIFAQGALPSDIDEVSLAALLENDAQVRIIDVLVLCGFASSNGEARRAIRGGGVRLDGTVIEDEMLAFTPVGGEILQVGKRRVARLTV